MFIGGENPLFAHMNKDSHAHITTCVVKGHVVSSAESSDLGNVVGSFVSPHLAPLHALEEERLASVHKHRVCVPVDDPLLQSVARKAARICGTPLGLVSIMEADSERFVGCTGGDVGPVARSLSFCAYAILEPDVLTVEDTWADPRFRENPYVVGEPFARFYVGAPVFDANGLPLGSVCAIDFRPQYPSSKCLLALRTLAAGLGAVLHTRLLMANARARGASDEDTKRLQSRLDAEVSELKEVRQARDSVNDSDGRSFQT